MLRFNIELLVVFFSFLFIDQIFSQENALAYYRMESFKNSVGDSLNNIEIIKRTRTDIYMNGGNDYKIKAEHRKISKKLKKHYWIVQLKDSIFINCRHFKIGKWYAYAKRMGIFLVFKASKTLTAEERSKMNMAGTIGGPLVGASMAGEYAVLRDYYMLNLNDNQLIHINDEKMTELLKKFPDLSEQYSIESRPIELKTFERYIKSYLKRTE